MEAVVSISNRLFRSLLESASDLGTILAEKAFSDEWFSDTYDLNRTKDQLRKLLELATTNQLFQVNGTLY